MTITKREILASITIIAVMLLIGFLINTKIGDYQRDKLEKYYKATKIEDSELFKYGMSTSVGNAFVYGELKAIDPVSFPEFGGEYLVTKKVTEEYTRHTRTVTYTDSKGKTKTKVEVYYTWDVINSKTLKAEKVIFNDVEFNTSQFEVDSGSHLDTVKDKWNYDIRYLYYGYPSVSKGTIFTYLANNNIAESNPYYIDKNITETIESLESKSTLFSIAFCLIWTILIAFAVYYFYEGEHPWLER